jgi:mannosyltransferase
MYNLKPPKGCSVFHQSYYAKFSKADLVHKITTVHDFTHEILYPKGLHSKLYGKVKYRAMLSSDTLLCVSNNTKTDLVTLYPSLSTKNIVVIPHGIENNSYANYQKDPKRTVLFVGSRAFYKNFQLLVKAIAKIPDRTITLSIIGPSLTKSESNFLNILLPGRYNLYESVSNKRKNEIFNKSTLFCYPSQYEGFGIPILEALSNHCPVLCSDIPVFKEIGRDCINYFSPNNEESLIREIQKFFMLSSSERVKVVEKGRTILDSFTLSKCIAKHHELYGL